MDLLHISIIAALKAGKEILGIYNSNFIVELKDDNSPLTLADKNANEAINALLRQTKIPIISEENKLTNFSERKEWSKCWVVDPLDGTKEFVKRNGEFTVNIALVENGKPVLGVIYVPVTKELYFADVSGDRSFKANLKDEDVAIDEILDIAEEIKPSKRKKNMIRVLGSRSHMNEETTLFIEELKKEYKKVEIVTKGSALKFCLMAEGKADMYPRFSPTMEWDSAAGQAICEAVGLNVFAVGTKIPLTYNKESLLNNNFLVTL